MRAFVRGMGHKRVVLKDNHQVILVYNPEELPKNVKSYIDLELSKEGTIPLGDGPQRRHHLNLGEISGKQRDLSNVHPSLSLYIIILSFKRLFKLNE